MRKTSLKSKVVCLYLVLRWVIYEVTVKLCLESDKGLVDYGQVVKDKENL